jgi:hypothetical protein
LKRLLAVARITSNCWDTHGVVEMVVDKGQSIGAGQSAQVGATPSNARRIRDEPCIPLVPPCFPGFFELVGEAKDDRERTS